jgi:hypothetical protein
VVRQVGPQPAPDGCNHGARRVAGPAWGGEPRGAGPVGQCPSTSALLDDAGAWELQEEEGSSEEAGEEAPPLAAPPAEAAPTDGQAPSAASRAGPSQGAQHGNSEKAGAKRKIWLVCINKLVYKGESHRGDRVRALLANWTGRQRHPALLRLDDPPPAFTLHALDAATLCVLNDRLQCSRIECCRPIYLVLYLEETTTDVHLLHPGRRRHRRPPPL